MKNNMRRTAMIITCISVLCMLSSCSSTPVSAPPEKVKPITFTALLSDTNAKIDWDTNPVCQEITKRTGVKLELEILSGDLSTRINTMIASGSYPDIILSIDNDNVARLEEANALISLDEYISNYGVNINKIFGKDIYMMRSEKDGKVYGLNSRYKEEAAQSNSLFHIQYDMLISAGYPKLKTLDDLYKLMAEYKSKHPTFNGLKTIGLTAWADTYGMNVTLNNAALNAAGFQNDGNYYVDENLDVKLGLTLPTTKEYFKWLNKLYLNDLLDPEAVVQKRERFVEKIASGRVLVATTEFWDMSDSEASLRSAGLDTKCYAQIPLTLSEDTVSHISNFDPYGTWKSVITKSCSNPLEAFKFFDTMWEEKNQILCNWGVEGLNYSNEGGKRKLLPGTLSLSLKDPEWKSKTGMMMFGMWSYGENVKGTDGQYIIPFGTREQLYEEQDEISKQLLTAYEIKTWKDLCPQPLPSKHSFVWKLTLPQNTIGAYAENIVNNEIRRKYLPRIVLANSNNEFESQWKDFVNEVNKAGIHTREKEISEALKKEIG